MLAATRAVGVPGPMISVCDLLCVVFQANVHYSSPGPTARDSSPSSVSVKRHSAYTITASITPTPSPAPAVNMGLI